MNPWRLAGLSLALCLSCLTPSRAATADWQGVAAFSLTRGGADIMALQHYDSSTGADLYRETVRAGGQYQFTGGVQWQPQGGTWALQATAGWHGDSINYGDNESIRFQRWPVELLALGAVGDKLRVGLGVRKSLRPDFHAQSSKPQLTTSREQVRIGAGPVLQVDYRLSGGWRAVLRHVREEVDITLDQGGGTYSGRFRGHHVGAGLSLEF
jgi:hypothetical protein